jgi:hypothetical protein
MAFCSEWTSIRVLTLQSECSPFNQSAHPSQESGLILNTWQRFRRPHSTAGQVNVRNEVVSGPLWFSPYSLIFLPNFGGLSDGE